MGLSQPVTPASDPERFLLLLISNPEAGGGSQWSPWSPTRTGLCPAEPPEGTQEMGRVPDCPQDRGQQAAEGREGGNGQGGTSDCSLSPGCPGAFPRQRVIKRGGPPWWSGG